MPAGGATVNGPFVPAHALKLQSAKAQIAMTKRRMLVSSKGIFFCRQAAPKTAPLAVFRALLYPGFAN